MVRPSFTRAQITDVDALEAHVSRLIDKIPKDGTTIDLSQLFTRLTMDSATEVLFGESTNSLCKKPGSGEVFADAFMRSQVDSFSLHLVPRMPDWLLDWMLDWAPWFSRMGKDIRIVHDFADSYVNSALSRRQELLDEKTAKEGRYVFLEELVRQTEDPIRIRSELLNILTAGRDTTASLLTNVWFMLGKHPEVWQKLQDEITTLDDQRPTFERIKNLRYTKAVINETLRLFPPVPVNSRQACEDTTIPTGGGPDGSAPVFAKKGTHFIWTIHSMHRRQDLYGKDAGDFRPARWLDDPAKGTKGLRPTWEYLPFNGGPRTCPGQRK
ncbi:hypothetical protein CDD83_4833 [Cordyceps sp. RAO-2017]|nr:hypothetical protein CDD83_4833 [Cordyceps sp. RAO-2017]